MKVTCQSFSPVINSDTRVLVLGSMPGPDALKLKQYYGYRHNHFWKIMPSLFGVESPTTYSGKINMLKKNRVGLWDVVAKCTRVGASDSSIRIQTLNDIPTLLKKYKKVRAIAVNGRLAQKVFEKNFKNDVTLPVLVMPSTSPAMAQLSVVQKTKVWSKIKTYL